MSRSFEIRRGTAKRRRRFARASDADPVVGEEDVLARVDAGHVAVDAIAARLDGAGSAGGGPRGSGSAARRRRRAAAGVARQADRQIRRAVGGGPRVRIVAGHATQRAAALAEAAGLEDSDRLETGQVGIVGPDLAGMGPGRMTMAGAAELQQVVGRERVRTEGELELGVRRTPPGRFDVRPPRAVTSLAGDVGDHRLLVDRPTVARAEAWVV